MKQIKVSCSFCAKKYYRTPGRVNEAQKFGWKSYCSRACQAHVLRKCVQRICGNRSCSKRILKKQTDIRKTKQSFCSHTCAAIVNNRKRAKEPTLHSCKNPDCSLLIPTTQAFCSPRHRISHRKIPKETYKLIMIGRLRAFYEKQRRIPLKREMNGIYKTAFLLFGSWNKAIIAAGLVPNPVIFAERQVAKDGHLCSSIAEKLIDDWLNEHAIPHKRNVPYPDKKHTADFLVRDVLVEFFGLTGELAEYDKHIRIKEKLAKQHGLTLLKIYPKDMYPTLKLDALLASEFLPTHA